MQTSEISQKKTKQQDEAEIRDRKKPNQTKIERGQGKPSD